MSLVSKLAAAFQQVAATVKPLLYLPAKPADGGYTLVLASGTAQWRSTDRQSFFASGPVTSSTTTFVSAITATTPVLQPGEYAIDAMLDFQSTNANTIAGLDLQAGGITIGAVQCKAVQAAVASQISLKATVTVTAPAAVALSLRVRRATGASAATFTNMRLMIERWG